MPDDLLTSGDLVDNEFRQVLRGYDPRQVADFLARTAEAFRVVEAERDRLAGRLAELGDRDLSAEFERVSRDLLRILEDANETADGLRSRAAAETERWRAEARAEADQTMAAAAGDAESLRRDAWETGGRLLAQARDEAENARQRAERDALAIIGEAEREAHRTVTSARREAEDLVRVAKMESDRLLVDAKSHHDEIIEKARREADQAQERAKALEARRAELLAELESVRATIAQLETQIDERRGLPVPVIEEPSGVRLVPQVAGEEPAAGEADSAEWRTEESVRVVPLPARPPKPAPVPEVPVDATAMADEVRRLRDQRAKEAKPPAKPGAAPREPDQVEALFDRLRQAGSSPLATEETEARQPPPAQESSPTVAIPQGVDLAELRTRMLLPIMNLALRGIKRQLTDSQNQALEGLRTSEAWRPDPDEVSGLLEPSLVEMARSSYRAGAEAAGELLGIDPPDLSKEGFEDLTPGIAAELGGEVEAVIEKAGREGKGGLQVSSSVARVYRAWRTDKAERRVLTAAEAAFDAGLREALDKAGVPVESIATPS